jgi:hypothetical protein
LEFLVKLVETFDQKADEVRILETAVALWNVWTHTKAGLAAANSSDFLLRRCCVSASCDDAPWKAANCRNSFPKDRTNPRVGR